MAQMTQMSEEMEKALLDGEPHLSVKPFRAFTSGPILPEAHPWNPCYPWCNCIIQDKA